VPASGPPPENRKITREEGEGLWVLWNEEQDYVAYGGKHPLRQGPGTRSWGGVFAVRPWPL